MTSNDIFNLLGLIVNIIGTLILAFSLSRYLTAIHGTLAIHDMQLNGKPITADVANLLKKGVENNRRVTTVGLIIVVIGFVIQLVPYVVNLLGE